MTFHTIINHSDSDVLNGLGLDRHELDALMKQGFVSSEYRHRNEKKFGPYYKLRWRFNGRQRVKYLGRDFARAALVHSALIRCRSLRRSRLDIGHRLRDALQTLRDARKQLELLLAERGVVLHGYTHRHRAGAKRSQTQSDSPSAER